MPEAKCAFVILGSKVHKKVSVGASMTPACLLHHMPPTKKVKRVRRDAGRDEGRNARRDEGRDAGRDAGAARLHDQNGRQVRRIKERTTYKL